MNVIAVANQKGGVGKTTSVVNLAAALGRRGQRVLVVDMDFQANATAAMAREPLAEGQPTMAHVLVGAADLSSVLVETTSENVMLAPADEQLSHADITLSSKLGRELALLRALEALPTKFDLVLIDTSPYLGLLTVNSLVAATQVLVPVSAEYLPMLGLKLLNGTIEQVRTNLQRPIEVLGYLITMYDRRFGMTNEVVSLLESQFGELILKSKVRVNSNLKAAPAHRQDIFALEAKTKKPWKGAEDFDALAKEVLTKLARSAAVAA